MGAVFGEADGFVAAPGFGVVDEDAQVDPGGGEIIPDVVDREAQELAAVAFAADLGVNDDKAESDGRVVVLIGISDYKVADGPAFLVDACQGDEAAGLKLRNVVLVNAVGKQGEETVSV